MITFSVMAMKVKTMANHSGRIISYEEAMKEQIADMNKHLYDAYKKIVCLQEENKKLRSTLTELSEQGLGIGIKNG